MKLIDKIINYSIERLTALQLKRRGIKNVGYFRYENKNLTIANWVLENNSNKDAHCALHLDYPELTVEIYDKVDPYVTTMLRLAVISGLMEMLEWKKFRGISHVGLAAYKEAVKNDQTI
tara:strand:+ start:67 stop:423 length:357 start_codon:yes stop_codon:yes gene_type:complete